MEAVTVATAPRSDILELPHSLFPIYPPLFRRPQHPTSNDTTPHTLQHIVRPLYLAHGSFLLHRFRPPM